MLPGIRKFKAWRCFTRKGQVCRTYMDIAWWRYTTECGQINEQVVRRPPGSVSGKARAATADGIGAGYPPLPEQVEDVHATAGINEVSAAFQCQHGAVGSRTANRPHALRQHPKKRQVTGDPSLNLILINQVSLR